LNNRSRAFELIVNIFVRNQHNYRAARNQYMRHPPCLAKSLVPSDSHLSYRSDSDDTSRARLGIALVCTPNAIPNHAMYVAECRIGTLTYAGAVPAPLSWLFPPPVTLATNS
jgi:hypothetical protein